MLKQKRLSAVIVSIMFLYTGCISLPNYGLSGSYMTPTYLQKPFYSDRDSSLTNLSVRYGTNLDTTSLFGDYDKMSFIDAGIYHSRPINKYLYLSYGAFGYLGNYTVAAVDKYTGKKSFYGINLTAEITTNLNLGKNIRWRPIGYRLGYLLEKGAYADFRKKAHIDSLLNNIHPGDQCLTMGFTNDLAIKFNQYEIGIFSHSYMYTFHKYKDRNQDTEMNIRMVFGVYIKYKRISLIGQHGLTHYDVGFHYTIQ